MSNKPIGYRNTKFSPDVPGKTSSRSEKLAELKKGAESRSKRVQVLIAPSVFEKLKRIDSPLFSRISNDDLLIQEIRIRIAPATHKFNEDVDAMSTELLNALSITGEISDNAHSAFLDSLMLSTVELYDNYQEILTELATPLSDYELEQKKQALMNIVIDEVNILIDRVSESNLLVME